MIALMAPLRLVNIAYGSVITVFLSNGDVGIFRRMPMKLPLILSIVAVVFKGRADLIAENLALRHNTTIGVLHEGENEAKPVIGNRVDIGCGAVIVGGIEVGDDVVIGANTVVVKDVRSESTVFGVPARPVRLMPTSAAPSDPETAADD